MTSGADAGGAVNGHSAGRIDDRLEALLVNLARWGLSSDDDSVRGEISELLERGRRAALLSGVERHHLALDIRRLCHIRDLPEVLSLSGVPVVYNFQRAFDQNEPGPWDRVPDSDGVTRGRRWSLLGFDVGYPIGIPASVLTVNAKYIEYYARQGFNVITYKTVRSRRWPAHEFPNWVYLEGASQPLRVEEGIPTKPFVGDRDSYADDPESFSTANSFGVPSEAPPVWRQDVADSLDRLSDGKLLIVSVMGSSELSELKDPEKLAADFVDVALEAQDVGAKVIELNLSCPNTLDPTEKTIKDPVCLDADLTELIVTRVADALDASTKLVTKLSWMRHEALERVLRRFVDRVDCVSGINTIAAPVVDREGRPTFGDRHVAGVSGVAIREFALDFVSSLARLKREHGWTFEVIGMGGVMNAEDVRALLRAGADAVQTATAAEDNPTLPAELLREPHDELSPVARSVLAVLEERADLAVPQLASAARVAPSAVRAGLAELRARGMIREDRRRAEAPTYRLDERALTPHLT